MNDDTMKALWDKWADQSQLYLLHNTDLSSDADIIELREYLDRQGEAA